jgi:cytochrome oxidase Cu insertion factor (SCO1/SenC/PrrC family)
MDRSPRNSTIARAVFAVTLALTIAAAPRRVSAQPDPNPPGLETGKPAPEFKLTDQQGKQRSLAGFRAEGKKIAIVFHRSAEW